MLVCDEAQWLSPECFELWRHLWDDRRTQIAIVFVGGGDCYEVLRREPMLSSRVYVWQEFRRMPRAQVLLYPVTDGSCKRDSHVRYAEGYLLETACMDWFYRLYSRTPADVQDWRISPLLAPDVSGLAPALMYLAGYDPLHDEGLAYAEKLKRAGNQVLLCEEPGMTHDFMRMSGLLEEVPVIHGRVASWLDGQLGC